MKKIIISCLVCLIILLPTAYAYASPITISFAGDCTLGYDYRYGYTNSFPHMFQEQNGDYGYFLKNVKSIFENSNLAIVNLETTLTDSEVHADKKFVFRGQPSFVNILKEGSVGAVSISNNHINDYLQKGYDDTLRHLDEAGILYFGLGNNIIVDVDGIKVGLLGYKYWYVDNAVKNLITKDIEKLKDDGADLVLVSFHWGDEQVNNANNTQITLGRHAIDAGADLVFGTHPHVMQGIELYKGKYIAYSLGNFCYGGHKNPADKDTYILQYTASFDSDKTLLDEIKIIPCSISSVTTRNNYQPTPQTGDDFERIKKRLTEFSEHHGTYLSDEMFVDFIIKANRQKELSRYIRGVAY